MGEHRLIMAQEAGLKSYYHSIASDSGFCNGSQFLIQVSTAGMFFFWGLKHICLANKTICPDEFFDAWHSKCPQMSLAKYLSITDSAAIILSEQLCGRRCPKHERKRFGLSTQNHYFIDPPDILSYTIVVHEKHGQSLLKGHSKPG